MNSYSTDPKDIRKFGLVGFLFFGVLAGVAVWRQKPLTSYTFGTLSLLFTSFCLFPVLLTPVYRGWMRAAHVIGTIMTAVILTVAYYFAVTPVAWAKRVFGGRPLPLKPDKNRPSYWVPRSETVQPRQRFTKRY
jgi:hypothetical protein